MRFCSFYFEQFFLDRSDANLMMLIIDVCLMLNCFVFEKFYLHYALCDFDSILWHCTKLFICQSIDREQIFNVTFENLPHWKILRTPLSLSEDRFFFIGLHLVFGAKDYLRLNFDPRNCETFGRANLVRGWKRLDAPDLGWQKKQHVWLHENFLK